MMLGNLSVEQIEEQLGIQLKDEEREELRAMRQLEAENISPGKWHCFQFPFVMVCGDSATAKRVYDILSPYHEQMQDQIRIIVEPKEWKSA